MGGFDDATPQTSDWPTAGRIPLCRHVSEDVLTVAARQTHVCHRWLRGGLGVWGCGGVGGVRHSSRHNLRPKAEDLNTSRDMAAGRRSQQKRSAGQRTLLPPPPPPVACELNISLLEWWRGGERRAWRRMLDSPVCWRTSGLLNSRAFTLRYMWKCFGSQRPKICVVYKCWKTLML